MLRERLENPMYPEHVVPVGSAILGEESRKKQKDKRLMQNQKDDLVRGVCALLNSGGGIVHVEISNKDFKLGQHPLGHDIEMALSDLTFSSESGSFFDYLQQGSNLFIFVKTWNRKAELPRICVQNTGLFTRSFTSKKMVPSIQVMNLIQKKSERKKARFSENTSADKTNEIRDFFFQKENLLLGEQLNFSESEYVEFKEFSNDKNISKRIKEILPEYISAFGNCKGGYLIIGVQDQGIVKGCFNGTDTSTFTNLREYALNKRKIVHLDCCSLKEPNTCELVFKEVLDDERKHVGYVLIFKITESCCPVFVDDPLSCIFENGEIRSLNAAEFIKMFDITNPEDSSLISQFTKLSISDQTPLSKPVYIKEGQETLQELQNNLFGDIEKRIKIQPEKLHSELCKENPKLQDVLKKQLPRSVGILILSRSWAVDIGRESNKNVLCEALLIAKDNYVTLYTVFNSDILPEDFEHSRLTALAIKQKLVNIGGYTRKVCVIPIALTFQDENPKSKVWPDIIYPTEYKVEAVEDLLPSLLIVMLCFKSLFSDQIGIEFFNLLSTEQYKVLSNKFHTEKHLFVLGVPGSGKTVLARMVIEKIKNEFNCAKKNILYICENQPLKEYIGRQNICAAVTRSTFVLKDFPQVQHIIVDEAQNFRVEDGDWYKKAINICQKASSKSMFWVFLDNFQTCHPFKTGLPNIAWEAKEFLTKGVRNACNIYNFMYSVMEEIASNHDPDDTKYLKKLLSNSKCAHQIPGVYKREKDRVRREIIVFVANACKRYLDRGYSEKDIAILCNTENESVWYNQQLTAEMRKLKLRVNTLAKANAILEDAIIVDSVRRFSGLERCIVFVIHSKPVQKEITANLLLCAASRAQTKLHILYEK